MYLAQDNFLKKITLIISFFSFLFLWDTSFNFFIQFRFLILLYFFYLIFYNFNEFKKIIFHLILIFLILLPHQYLNILYEISNKNFLIISKLNEYVINKWPNEIREIYYIANEYNLSQFLAIIGVVVIYSIIKLNKIELKNYYYIFSYIFIIFIFVFDILINIYKIGYTSEWTKEYLCSFDFVINNKLFPIFLENSHFGMIAPSIFIYIIYNLSKKFNLFDI